MERSMSATVMPTDSTVRSSSACKETLQSAKPRTIPRNKIFTTEARRTRRYTEEASILRASPCPPCLRGEKLVFVIVIFAQSTQTLSQMISDAQGVGHDGQRRVHRPGGWEEAGIDHVQVVQVVRLAVCVQHRRLGIVSEAACAILVGHAGQRDPLAYVGIHVQQIFCAVDVLQQALELGLKPAVALKIARRVAQHDPTLPCEGDPVF